MSLSIEILQLFTFRATDVDDLIMNTTGALVGYGIAKLILRKNGKAEDKDRDGIKLVAMIFIIGLVIVFVRYPFMEFLLKWLKLA